MSARAAAAALFVVVVIAVAAAVSYGVVSYYASSLGLTVTPLTTVSPKPPVKVVTTAAPVTTTTTAKAKGVISAEAEEVLSKAPPSIREKLAAILDKVSPQTLKCIGCHMTFTPDIVMQWLNSKHAMHKPDDVLLLYAAIGQAKWYDKVAPKFKNYPYVVGCYECHGMFAVKDRPDVINHFGFKIVPIVTLRDCGQCHPKEATEITWTWHSFAALNGPLKPWYAKIVKYAVQHNDTNMLPPVYKLQRDKDMITWDWYKEYAKDLLDYFMHNSTPQEAALVQLFGTPYDYDFKNIVSPLYPASGVLNSSLAYKLGIKFNVWGCTITNVMQHPMFKNAYVYHGCLECHGSLVVPYYKGTVTVKNPVTGATIKMEIVKYWGWPSNGAGRIDPDGSLGTCTACHPRHTFSIEQARDPWTCGQCHLGYDHPHIEIFEESKHGNIYFANVNKYNLEALPIRVGVDQDVPNCAMCHMSTIATPDGTIVVEGTHDLAARLVWDMMHFFSYPKPKWPDLTQNAIIKHASQLTGAGLLKNHVAFEGYRIVKTGVPKPGEMGFPRVYKVEYYGELAKHRETMKKVCSLCHSSQWVNNYFMTFDQVIIDYNVTAHYAFDLLQKAYKEGIQDPRNKIDEYMEFMWYYIWHHDGRRWRNGAAMMGPDYAHWFGIVDTVMDKLGRMIEYYRIATEIKELKQMIGKLAGQLPASALHNMSNIEAAMKALFSVNAKS